MPTTTMPISSTSSTTTMPTSSTSSTPPKPPSTIRVSALLSTFIHLPFHTVFQDCFDSHYPDSSGSYVPVLSFLLEHPGSGEEGKGKGKKVLFDLGVRKNAEGYPPSIPRVSQSRAAVSARKDVAELLIEGGIDPKDITHIIHSHLHWDHTGDPSPFVKASIVVGGGARSILSTSSSSSPPDEETWVYPTNPLGTVLQFPETMPVHFVDFEDEEHSHPRLQANEGKTEETEKNRWHGRVIAPFATFEHAVDFFGDGSLYLVDTPGHYPGHISALARVSSSSSSPPPPSSSSSSPTTSSPSLTSSDVGSTYVFLGGDVCHNRQCYVPGGTRLMSAKIQWDVGRARESVGRVRRLCEVGFVGGKAGESDEEKGEVVVILAHEAERLEEGMPLFPGDLGEWAVWRAGKQRAARASRRAEAVVSGENGATELLSEC